MISISLAIALGVTQLPLGYPIFVHADGRRCTFGIQDMIMLNVSDAGKWMQELPGKDRQIDIVWSDEADKACIAKARALVHRAGFSNIVVRVGTDLQYQGGYLPNRKTRALQFSIIDEPLRRKKLLSYKPPLPA